MSVNLDDRRWQHDRRARWYDVGTWSATALSRLLASYAILQGATVIAYGPDRWTSSPALQVALTVPGQTATWGGVLLLAGCLALYGSVTRHMRLTALGHALAAIWSMFFAVSMAPALLPHTSGPTTGVFVYGAESVAFMVLAYGAWRLR